eukprot:11162413-Lingulodinium_polyedra.AAC.1
MFLTEPSSYVSGWLARRTLRCSGLPVPFSIVTVFKAIGSYGAVDARFPNVEDIFGVFGERQPCAYVIYALDSVAE